jgi:hypothetical protein
MVNPQSNAINCHQSVVDPPSIRNPQSAIRTDHGEQVTSGDEDQQKAIACEQRKVFAHSADHRSEQIRAEVARRGR